MDTAHLEYTAEDLIAHKLQQSGMLVAKPKFDRNGADLLCFLHVCDAAKFCRVQCKGRSLKNSSSSNVEVPKEYVTDGFVLFLYVEKDHSPSSDIFCFFGNEIRDSWRLSKKQKYCLNFSRSNYEKIFSPYLFGPDRVTGIKKAIINADLAGEFNRVILGYMEAQESGSDSAMISGTISPKPSGRTER